MKGTLVPVVDVIVAEVAIKEKLTLVTKDRHFEWIKEDFEELELQSV